MLGPGSKATDTNAEEKNLGRCQEQGLVYNIKCLRCAHEGKTMVYIGESSRTGYQRGLEHLRGLRDQLDASPLWKHQLVAHKGEETAYTMEVEETFRTPLERQVAEGVRINLQKKGLSMNSKSEWGQPGIPRITLEDKEPGWEEAEVGGKRARGW